MSKANKATDNAEKKYPSKIIKKLSSLVIGALFILVMIAFFSLVMQAIGGKKPSVFGYRIYFVLTDSMEPTLNVKDIMISEVLSSAEETQEKVKIGDIITFTAEYGMQAGMIITHRVVEEAHYDEHYDRYVFTTKGDNEKASIDPAVPVENVQAVLVKKSNILTALYKFFTSTIGILSILIVPLCFIMGTLICRLVVIVKKPANSDDSKQTEEDRIESIKKKAIEEYILEERKKEIAEKAVKEFIENQKNKGE